jgi:hypothetical protein
MAAAFGSRLGSHPGWNISLRREPFVAPAINDPDGECPKPPSPRFPVWKPRYLDGGVFPFSDGDATGGLREPWKVPR